MATKNKKNSLPSKGWNENPLYFFDPTLLDLISEQSKPDLSREQIQFAKKGSMRKLFSSFISLTHIEGFGVYIVVKGGQA